MPVAVFVAPFLLDATVRFISAAAALPGVQLALVSQDSTEALPGPLRRALAAHYRIDGGTDPAQIAEATTRIGAHLGRVDRLVGMLEQLQVPLGVVRDALGIAGMGAEVARNFRDKSRMKTIFSAAGVPCAGFAMARSAAEVRDGVVRLGLPVVVKPPAGAGARSTFRVDTVENMESWLRVDAPTPEAPALLEQLVRGDEHSFDSVVIGGQVVWHSVSRYHPTPLEVLENPWIQWAVLLPRHIDGPEYDGIRGAAAAGLHALGIDTGFTHMEWFRLGGGRVALSEVAARPPGAQFTSLLSYAHETDMYATWARLEILSEFAPPERRYAVGAAYLRGQGQGTVRTVEGLEVLQRELGDLVVEARIPSPGQARADTYEGEGYVILRHPRTDVVEAGLRRVVEVARVHIEQR